MRKFIKILAISLIILPNIVFADDEIEMLTKSLQEVQEKFNELKDPVSNEAKIIDDAIKEINKATLFVTDTLKNSSDDAIKGLEFIDRTLGEISNLIPKEATSDMSNLDMSKLNADDLKEVTKITKSMNQNKKNKLKKVIDDLVSLDQKGLKTFEIIDNLNSIGVDTLELNIDINKLKQKKNLSKKELADSYKGTMITSSGNEVIVDKEIENKLTELEQNLKKNNLNIQGKQASLVSLNNQLEPISLEINRLEDEKSKLTNEYNAQLSKLRVAGLNTNDVKVNKLTEKFEKDLQGISKEIETVNQKSSNLRSEISQMNLSINSDLSLSNSITAKINKLNRDKFELKNLIATKKTEIDKLKNQTSSNANNTSILELEQKVVQSKNLQKQLTDLESELSSQNSLLSQKRSQIADLNSEISPLDDEIGLLNTKKAELLSKYNSELENLNNSVNSNEIIQSKDLANNLNNEINSVTNQIKDIENKKGVIQQNLSQLNTEISNETNIVNELSSNLISLNNKLSKSKEVLESKELELYRLKNLPTNLSKTNQSLEEQLQRVSLERDFIESQFAKSIDKEVEAVEYFYPLLDKMSEKEIDFAMEEVGILLDGDTRKANAFEIRKYGTFAGLSQAEIQEGINAINNDDWETTKKVYKNITEKLSKNPNWVVDIPSEAELNVMVAEEKALQQAVEVFRNGDKIKRQVDAIIEEKTKPYQELSKLNITTLQYAALQEGSLEAEMVNKEFENIVNNDLDLKSLTSTLEEKQKQLTDIKAFQELKNQEINKAIKPLQDELTGLYAQVNNFNQTYTQKSLEKMSYINSIGGYAALYRDRGNPNYSDWVRSIGKFDQELGDIRSKAQNKMTDALNINNEIYKIQIDNATPPLETNNWINTQQEVISLSSQKIMKEANASKQARANVITMVNEAKSNIQKITSDEISKNPDYNYVDKVGEIITKIPSFSQKQLDRAYEAMTGIGNRDIWLGGRPIDVGDQSAALRAALDQDPNTYEAYKTAVEKIKQIGATPTSQYMTGPYWEMTNVKLAMIVKSKMEGNMDYVYVAEEDRIQLSTSERKAIEKELSSILGNNNPKLNALNKQTDTLKSQINNNKAQLNSLNTNISKLEAELNSIKLNEEKVKSEISKLNSDLFSKQNIINEKKTSIQSLQTELDPYANEIIQLEQKRQTLNIEVEKQLSIIADNATSTEKITSEANKIKDKLNEELSEVDNKINILKTNSETLKTNISNLNNEIKNLETKTPDLSAKLSILNKELDQYVGLEAQISALTNENKTKIENIDKEVIKLEKEIANLKINEEGINSQLNELTSQLNLNQSTVVQKKLSISNLENQLNPINNSIKNLETQQNELTINFNKELEEIEKQVQSENNQTLDIKTLKTEFDQKNLEINEEINKFQNQAKDLTASVSELNNEIKNIELNSPKIEQQIVKLNQDLKDFTNLKADLAYSEAKKLEIIEKDLEAKLVEKIGLIENKSIISINGDINTYRLIDTNLLTDQSGKFEAPKGTVTVNGSVYTAGAVEPELLYSFKTIDEEGDLKINFSEEAARQLQETGKMVGGQQTYDSQYGSGSLGAWVLVDAKTGEQMANPVTGHSGSLVCDGSTCGPTGSFGKKAASFGGMYVLENLADPLTGNVAGRCNSGGCKFDITSEQATAYMTTALNIPEGLTTGYTGHVNGQATFKGQGKKNPVIRVVDGAIISDASISTQAKTSFSKATTKAHSEDIKKFETQIAQIEDESGNTQKHLLERTAKAANQAADANKAEYLASADLEKGIITSNTLALANATEKSLDTASGVAGDLANNLESASIAAAAAATENATEANIAAAEAAKQAADAARAVANEAAAAAAEAAEEAAKQTAQIAKEAAQAAAEAAAASSAEVASAAKSAVDDAGIDYALDNVQSLISQIQKDTGGDISSIAKQVVDEYRNTSARKDRKDSLFKDEKGYYWSRSEVKPGDNVEWRIIGGQRRACKGSCANE